jgi:hypothetical protein
MHTPVAISYWKELPHLCLLRKRENSADFVAAAALFPDSGPAAFSLQAYSWLSPTVSD